MTKIKLLSYPYDMGYPNSINAFYGTAAGTPCMPTDNLVTIGDGDRNEAGVNWQFQSYSSLTLKGTVDDLYQSSTMGTQQGYGAIWTSTNISSFNGKFWFDVGAMPNAIDAQSIVNTARSSWMKNVTSCWFVLNNQGTSTSNDCRVSVVRTALRYFNPNTNRVVILDCPSQIQGPRYNYSVYGGDPQELCGYALSSANASEVESFGYMFLGFRIMLALNRNTQLGVRPDTINCFINGLKPGFGDPGNSYDADAKKIICRRSQVQYRNYIASKPYIEVG